MSGLIVAAIVVSSVAAYLVAGYYTGRAMARMDHEKHGDYGDIEMTFVIGVLFWPVTLPFYAGLRLWGMRDYTLAEQLIPEKKAAADERIARDMQAKMDRQAREIRALERQLGIKGQP